MTIEELDEEIRLQEARRLPPVKTTCSALVNGNGNVNPRYSRIEPDLVEVVGEDGKTRFMWITQDGRLVPVEAAWGEEGDW